MFTMNLTRDLIQKETVGEGEQGQLEILSDCGRKTFT